MATDDSKALRTRMQQGVENGERFITIEIKGYKQSQQVTVLVTIAAVEGWCVNAVWRDESRSITNVLFESSSYDEVE